MSLFNSMVPDVPPLTEGVPAVALEICMEVLEVRWVIDTLSITNVCSHLLSVNSAYGRRGPPYSPSRVVAMIRRS
jgi:hypothetical protein